MKRLILQAMVVAAGLLASSAAAAGLGLLQAGSVETSPAYEWAQRHADGRLLSIQDLAVEGPGGTFPQVIWWDERSEPNLSETATSPRTREAIRRHVERGGGLLLSGYAPQAAATWGFTSQAPTTVVREPKESGRWGFRPLCPAHPIFGGMPAVVYTMAEHTRVDNIIAWWDNPGSFDGAWLADTESSIGKMAIGELRFGRGRVLVVGGGAFDFAPSSGQNGDRVHLERLAAAMLDHLSSPSAEAMDDHSLIAWWTFDEEDGTPVALDAASGQSDALANNFDRPERHALVDGSRALVLDGFSTWLRRDSGCAPLVLDEGTWSAWIAPRSYPPQTAPIFEQRGADAGYALELSRYGRWGMRVNIGGVWHALWAPEPLPRSDWSHIAAVYTKDDHLRLYLNGREVASQTTFHGSISPAREAPFMIGASATTGHVAEIFPLSVINGLLDDVRIHRRALSEKKLQELAKSGTHKDHPGHLQLSPARFANDPHRPVYHPIPESDWTNEPHGLVQMPDGRYHLYYQKNPAGPYWEFIHWGHMSSTDLLHWRQEPIALWPEEGFDSHGVWSGHAVNDDGELKLVYTGVDGHRAVMALAVPTDAGRTLYRKHEGNPIVDGRPRGESLLDFRDPFLWREADGWHMIIGAGVPDVGGTTLHYRGPKVEGPWEYTGLFFTGRKERTGAFWEMPLYLPMEPERSFFGVSELPAINEYWIGRNRNGRFVPRDEEPRRLEVINHLLSPTVAKDNDGRWLSIAIIPETRSSREQLKAGWAHLFSIPRVWSLHPGHDVLLQNPAPELEELRRNERNLSSMSLPADEWFVLDRMNGSVGDLVLEIEPGESGRIDVGVRRSADARESTVMSFDVNERTLRLDRCSSSLNAEVQRDERNGFWPATDGGRSLRLRLLLDNSVIEGFINEGHAFSTRVYPTLPDSTGIAIRAHGGGARLVRASYWDMAAPQAEAAGKRKD